MKRFLIVLSSLTLATAVPIHAQGTTTTTTKTATTTKPAVKVTLPAAVDAAFKKAYPHATIKNVSKEDGNYEVESMDGTQRRDLIYKPDGTVVEYEELLTEAQVPAAVVAAVKARYPKATITLRERLVKDGTSNIELGLKGAAVAEVVLTPEGVWVTPKAPVKGR